MITEASIESELTRLKSLCMEVVPAARWKHAYTGISITPLTKAYGKASPCGHVYINRSFVNSHSNNKLKQTIVHELAHLIVGIAEGHNRKFKACLACLMDKADVNETNLLEEATAVKDAVNYKYRLVAFLDDGRVLDCGGAYRRTMKYKNYTKGHRFQGQPITKYEYLDSLSALPENLIRDTDL